MEPLTRATPLLLRPWRESDDLALRAAIDEDVAHLKPWLSWTREEPVSLEATRARLRDWVAQYEAGTGLRHAVTPAADPAVILGGASLNTRVGPGGHDVGYWVRASAAGKGVTRSAVAALVIRAFSDGSIDRLVIQCDPGNAPSMAVARSSGFRPIDDCVLEYADGTPRPVHRFELLRREYEANEARYAERAGRVRFA